MTARISFAFWLFVSVSPCTACFYGAHALDPDKPKQTTAKDLINEKFIEAEERPRGYFPNELQKAQQLAPQHANDAAFQDDLGFLFYKNGRHDEALNLWKALLLKEPNRFTTLCNLATAYQGLGKYDTATTCLQEAVKVRAGFRSNVEVYHLDMIQFQKKQSTQPTYAVDHLFISELTPVWSARRAAPESFESVKPFPDIRADGVAELLRQFPRFGDGWLALGILLEHEGDHYWANRAYERALKFGSTRRLEVKNYLATYTPFAMEHDSSRIVARRLKWLAIAMAGGGVLFFGLRFTRMVVLDISAARREKEETNRPKKNDGPL